MNRCVLFFTKYPEPGKVKTRLTPFLSGREAAEVHRLLAEHTVGELKRMKTDFFVCYHPPRLRRRFEGWLGRELTYLPQSGRELGGRMKNAFQRAFQMGYDRIILIGSDIPDITAELMKDSFRVLAGKGAVIGPSKDGGYYLIGFQKEHFSGDVFKGLKWGTDSVYADTRSYLNRKFEAVGLMPELADIDTIEDLSGFAEGG